MILKFFFSQLSASTQVKFLKRKGIVLGSRMKDGRKVYVYMLRELFVEVVYKNDNVDETPERLNLMTGLKKLNNYLEKEFKTSF